MRGKIFALGACGCMSVAASATAASSATPQLELAAQNAPQLDAPVLSDPATLTQSVEGKLQADAARTLRTAVRTATHKALEARRRAERQGAAPAGTQTVAVPAVLQAIAQCESSGNPSARSGPYGGLFQFDQQTWASVGGTGDPASASAAEQEMRAAMLYQQRGTQAWPVCGAGK